MDKKAKEGYRQLIQPRYQRATKKVKQRILDEFCTVCSYNRKYAIGLLQKPARQRPKAKQTQDIKESLPFPLLGYNSDNGGKFLNYHLVRYFAKPLAIELSHEIERP